MRKGKANNPKSSEGKEALINRLHRIEGQVQGIEKMVKEDKDCLAVIQQIVAVRSALVSVGTKILARESCQVAVKKDRKKFEKIIATLLNFS